METQAPFWKTKTLAEMSPEEWEQLCDGCGQCCRLKIEEEDGTISETNLACRLLDLDTCQCQDYARRHFLVPQCASLTPDTIPDWMPRTCAYRLIKEGKPLPDWHHLVSGDRRSVHAAGMSVKGQLISESWICLDTLLDADTASDTPTPE